MSNDAFYRAEIARLEREDLLKMWAEISAGNPIPNWNSGKPFEYLILRAFELEGAEVKYPFSVKMEDAVIEQIDGVVYSDHFACIIECKDETERINIESIAKLRNQLIRRPAATIGMLFSRSGFTDPAITLTQFVFPQTILLWEGDEVGYALEKQIMRRALAAKFRVCVEKGISTWDITTEEFI